MKLKINNKENIGQCNALSYIFYKKVFKINIFEDLEKLRELLVNITEEQNVIEFYEILYRLVYILLFTYNQNIEEFEIWIKTIKIEDLTEEIINKTIEEFLKSFIDEEVIKELEKIPNNSGKSIFPEHEFLKICMNCGLHIEDLKLLTYIDVVKIFLVSCAETKQVPKFKEATQADWDRLALL